VIAQRHKILRQVIELRECPPEEAGRARSVLRDAYYRRLLPAIERICSELSSPDRVHRIDTLEIDLGPVPLEALEPAIADRFEAAFSGALTEAIDDAPEFDAELELLGYFLWTGSLPWWADRGERNALEAALDGLIRRAPQALRRTLREAPDQERTRRRIVRAYSDRALADLSAAMAPALSAAHPDWSAEATILLRASELTHGRSARDARNAWWEEVLDAADAEDVWAVADSQRFFRALFSRLVRRLDLDYRALLADLRRALDGSTPPWLRDLVDGLWGETEGEQAPALDAGSAGTEPARLLEQLPPGAQRTELEHLPARLREQVLRVLRAGGAADPDALLALLRDARDAPARKEDEAADLRFSDTDALYVENAGLVILWPFLEKFFGRLGLIEKKKFKDAASVQRAAGLLQYVAAGDPSPSEYLLPLNKVLCGMAPEEVFDFGPEITSVEI
jgi:hypothetical protein